MLQRRDLFKGICAAAAAPVLGSAATQAIAMPRQDKWSLSAIHLTALNLPPEKLAVAAHAAGYDAIGIRINPISKGSVSYPYKAGSKEIRAFKSLLADLGMRVNGVDGFALNSNTDPTQFAGIFEACGELGIKSLCICGDAPDKPKFAAMFAKMCEMAKPYGFRIDLEFMAWRTIGTLEQAYELVKMAGCDNGTIAVDSLHLYRSGGTAADLDKIPARFLGDIHLCDAVKNPPIDPKLIAQVRAGKAKLDSTFGVEVPVSGLAPETVLKLSDAHSIRVLNKL